MYHSKTLSDREEDLVTAQNTTFGPKTKAELVRHAAGRINDTLLACDVLASLSPELAEIDKLIF